MDLQNIKHVWYFTDPPWLYTDLGSAYLETIPSGSLRLVGSTSRPVMVQYQDTTSQQAIDINWRYLKWSDLVTSCQDELSWQHLSRRNWEYIMTSHKQKLARRLQQQTSQEVCSTSQPHFTHPQPVGYQIYVYIKRVSLHVHHLLSGIWHMTFSSV